MSRPSPAGRLAIRQQEQQVLIQADAFPLGVARQVGMQPARQANQETAAVTRIVLGRRGLRDNPAGGLGGL
jgi:hypothetical protein